MNTLKNPREKEKSCASESNRFTKRVGSIVYEVEIHFNQDAKESMNDKILRLMRRDMETAARNMGAAVQNMEEAS